jgi:putative glutamine amidotransferase
VPGPRIAITAWRRELPTFLDERTLLYTLADEYVRCVVEAGGLPILVPHVRDEDEADAILDVVDGLLLSGGGDVHPASYGADVDGSYDIDLAADASELAIARRAQARRLPTLAICRGMQLVVAANGGTLHQHIGVPGTIHPVGNEPSEVLAARHPVDVLPESRLAAAFGAGEREVNTIHHQAIDRMPAGFHVTAWAPDGMIEAIESDDPAWAFVGVQWHPEKLEGADAPLFAAFLADVERHRAGIGRVPAARSPRRSHATRRRTSYDQDRP